MCQLWAKALHERSGLLNCTQVRTKVIIFVTVADFLLRSIKQHIQEETYGRNI